MNRLRNRIVRYVFYSIVVVLLLLLMLFILPGHLYKDNPADADIMVVEGWLPGYALELAIKEYYSENYMLMVTAGNPKPDEFRMGSAGSLIFDVSRLKSKYNNKKIFAIRVNASGTKADKLFPYFNVLLNDSVVGGSFVRRRNREYEFGINSSLYEIDTVKINFINDTYTKWKDRNLNISYIDIEDIRIPAYSCYVYYDINNREIYNEYEPRFNSYADYSAFILKYLGFKDSIVPVQAVKTSITRTYSCALAFRKWFENSPFKGKSVNIVSLGPHSRRTWMIYKKVLGKNADVGIIMIPNKGYNQNNWWKSLAGIKDTIHEMASYIYTLVVLPFLKTELK